MTEHVRSRGPLPALAAACVAGAGLIASCMPPPRMCSSSKDCASASSCVAGRCVLRGAVPAVTSARREIYRPSDIGYVSRDAEECPPDAALATLGRSDGARVLLRFPLPLAPAESVVEAFVVLERAPGVASDPAPIVLYPARVVDRWDGRRLSWAQQPRVEDLGLAETPVSPSSGPRVRLDVRELVERARRRGRRELSVAVLAEGDSPTGISFALSSGAGRCPKLELYVK